MPPKKNNNSKKKKANPLRGYGTVSVPKKKDPEAEEAEAAAALAAAEGTTTPAEVGPQSGADGTAEGTNGNTKENGGGDGKKEGEGGEGSWDDPEEVEKRELHSLAERIRPGCDKEINRIVKVGFLFSPIHF